MLLALMLCDIYNRGCCVHWLQQAEQEYVAKVEAALEASVVDEDQLIEERRRRRQEILAKHQQDQAPQPGETHSVNKLIFAILFCQAC